MSVSDFGLDALFQGRQFDAKDDVYAFGALMYEVLSGHKPTIRTGAANPAEGSSISTELQNIILFCLNPDPRYRYADGSEVLENLLRIRQGKVPSPPANRPGQKLMSPLVLGMVAAAVVVLTICVYLFASQTRSPNLVSPASAPRLESNVQMTRNNGSAPYQFPAAGSNIRGALNTRAMQRFSKDTIKNAATLGAVGGAVMYQSMSQSDKERAAKAAAGSAAGAWQKWKSMDPQEKGPSNIAAGLFGKAARLWKSLPDN